MGWAGWDHIFTHGCFICIIWYTLCNTQQLDMPLLDSSPIVSEESHPTGNSNKGLHIAQEENLSQAWFTKVYILYSRVEWLWRQKCYTFYVVPNCWRTPIPKVHVLMLPFHLSQGLRKCWLKKKKLRSLWFFKIENFAARARLKLSIVWNWAPKYIPDRKPCVVFEIRKKD